MLTSILALMLVPAILLNAVLWYERFAGLGIYDPAMAADPPLQQRPLLVPLLVGFVALGRLGLGRARLIAPRYRWALLIIATVAALTAACSRIPEPSFHWGPTGATFDERLTRSWARLALRLL